MLQLWRIRTLPMGMFKASKGSEGKLCRNQRRNVVDGTYQFTRCCCWTHLVPWFWVQQPHCGKREFFFEFDSSFKDNVKMGNNSCLSVHGRGRIRIEMNGIIHVITDVFFVPELKNNLLSLGQLMEKVLLWWLSKANAKFSIRRGVWLWKPRWPIIVYLW